MTREPRQKPRLPALFLSVTPGLSPSKTPDDPGNGHMILMGHRSGNQDNVMIIEYVPRQDIRNSGSSKVRRPRSGRRGQADVSTKARSVGKGTATAATRHTAP